MHLFLQHVFWIVLWGALLVGADEFDDAIDAIEGLKVLGKRFDEAQDGVSQRVTELRSALALRSTG